jgi:hypothetical protein
MNKAGEIPPKPTDFARAVWLRRGARVAPQRCLILRDGGRIIPQPAVGHNAINPFVQKATHENV